MESLSVLHSTLFNESVLIVAVLTLIGNFWLKRSNFDKQQVRFLFLLYSFVSFLSLLALLSWIIPLGDYWEKLKNHVFVFFQDAVCGIIAFLSVFVSFYLLINEDWW